MTNAVERSSPNNAIPFPGDLKVVKQATNTTVDPIRDKKDIARIQQYLQGKSERNLCLFTVGINVGLRAEDLRKLRFCDVLDKNGDAKSISIVEHKTKKIRKLVLNAAAAASIERYMKKNLQWDFYDYLFKSRNGANNPISVRQIEDILKDVQHTLALPYNLGSHSLRKTFGYHLFMENQQRPEILAYLQSIFRHSSSAITLRYIGLTAEREKELCTDLNLGSEMYYNTDSENS